MDFGCFILLFGKGYQRMINERKIEFDEPKFHNKKTFCRELLLRITKDENIVIYKGADNTDDPRALSTFESFYRKNDPRSLHPIAVCIIEKNAMDRAKFKRFLKQYTCEFSKDTLLKNYQKYYPNTTLKTLLNSITDEYVRIICEAANEPDRRQGDTDPVLSDSKDNEAENGCLVQNPAEVVAASSEPVPVPSNQKDIEGEESGKNTHPLYAVDISLNKLIKLGRTIADYEKEKEIGKTRIFRSPLRSELQSEFKRLRLLADALLTSGESPTASALDQIAELIFELTAERFVLTEFEYRIVTPHNERLHQLLDLVDKLKTESDSQQ